MIRKALLLRIGNRQVRRLRRTGRLLIVLALSSLGCARGDWTSETLTLVDVTGTWEGLVNFRGMSGGIYEQTITLVLLQKGSKVNGAIQAPDGASGASIEGQVKGETFSWQMTGPLIKNPVGNPSGRSYRGEATVNSDELTGRADGQNCPCTLILHRVSTDAPLAPHQPRHARERSLSTF